jgi:hypothetical protein
MTHRLPRAIGIAAAALALLPAVATAAARNPVYKVVSATHSSSSAKSDGSH